MVHKKQLKLTAPIVRCALPPCIAQCSVHLLGSAVVERDFALESDDD